MNFYPRPPRGGRHVATLYLRHWNIISIHALREEGDRGRGISLAKEDLFLSTPSARRATGKQAYIRIDRMISIHALREEGDPSGGRSRPCWKISIHALREEGDS